MDWFKVYALYDFQVISKADENDNQGQKTVEIKLYNDIAFKWIFGRQEQTGPLIDFLNSVVTYEGGIPRFKEVLILNPYDKIMPFKNEKQGILDIRAKETKSEEWVDLEVQVLHSDDYPQRSKYYLAGMYRDQLEKTVKAIMIN